MPSKQEYGLSDGSWGFSDDLGFIFYAINTGFIQLNWKSNP
jgi:hypothetical protein